MTSIEALRSVVPQCSRPACGWKGNGSTLMLEWRDWEVGKSAYIELDDERVDVVIYDGDTRQQILYDRT